MGPLLSVKYGWPGLDKATRKMIYTDGNANGEQAVASLKAGRTFYNETAQFEVTCRVEAVAGDQEDADTACEALALELAECIADNRTLETSGVGLVKWIKSVGWVNASAFNDNGYLAMLTYTFEYNARLT